MALVSVLDGCLAEHWQPDLGYPEVGEKDSSQGSQLPRSSNQHQAIIKEAGERSAM